MVFPLEAVTMSPGLMHEPLIIFSDAADMKWTCQSQRDQTIETKPKKKKKTAASYESFAVHFH